MEKKAKKEVALVLSKFNHPDRFDLKKRNKHIPFGIAMKCA